MLRLLIPFIALVAFLIICTPYGHLCDSPSGVCAALSRAKHTLQHKAGRAARWFVYSVCAPDEYMMIRAACKPVDDLYFDMELLRNALFAQYDQEAGPRVEMIKQQIEEDMRVSAVAAWKSSFYDMSAVAEQVIHEQRKGLHLVSRKLEAAIQTMLSDSERTIPMIRASKFNTLWIEPASAAMATFAPETVAFVAKALNVRKITWMQQIEEETDAVRTKLRSPAELSHEMSTNPRFKAPKMPELTRSEKWAQFSKEMLVLLGSVSLMGMFA